MNTNETQKESEFIQVSQEQIETWKAQYINVFRLPLATGETCYVRSPSVKELEFAQSLMAQGKYISYNISLFKQCFLGGDDITGNETKLMSTAGQMMQTIETVVVTVEKL
jgi:hypothetical protein